MNYTFTTDEVIFFCIAFLMVGIGVGILLRMWREP